MHEDAASVLDKRTVPCRLLHLTYKCLNDMDFMHDCSMYGMAIDKYMQIY
jgi:hypothetical protein